VSPIDTKYGYIPLVFPKEHLSRASCQFGEELNANGEMGILFLMRFGINDLGMLNINSSIQLISIQRCDNHMTSGTKRHFKGGREQQHNHVSAEQKERVLQRLRAGESPSEIAQTEGISRSAVMKLSRFM